MLELSIPEAGEEVKRTKDIIFTILTEEQTLTLMEVTNKIRKNYNISITYQAVRKAVESMHNKGILVKEGKKYSLSKEWILKLRSILDQLLEKYDKGKRVHGFSKAMAKENYAVYTFNNLYDLDYFWGEVLASWKNNATGKEGMLLGHYHYDWWFLINLGRETRIFERIIKKGIKIKMLVLRDLPLTQWGTRIYSGIGIDTKIVEEDNYDETIGLNIFGDSIIQVKYPKKIIKKLKEFYEKYKTYQDMSMKEVTEIAHMECEIKFTVFKNPMIAKELREKILRSFS